jgi:hypothetical protein
MTPAGWVFWSVVALVGVSLIAAAWILITWILSDARDRQRFRPTPPPDPQNPPNGGR